MNKNEKNLLDELSKSVDSKMNYNDISNEINFSKYEKKRSFSFVRQKRLLIAFSSFVLVSLLIVIVVLFPNENNKGNDSKVNMYNGFIKDAFKESIGNGPWYENSGPLPPPPVIDGYFNSLEEDSSSEGDYNGENTTDELAKPSIKFNISGFEYIYEVEYKNTFNIEYICVYIEKNLAEKIYEENQNVCDAPNAASLDIVNGSIVDWFYSKNYYSEDKVFWGTYTEVDKIYSEIDGFVCAGVYQIQERVILREIFSNTIVNITDYIYSSLSFSNTGNEYLTPVRYELNNYITWYASDAIIDETNINSLFLYSQEFECSIDVTANTIELKTFAIQDEEELSKNYSTSLKDYHKLSNLVIVENKYPDKELGEETYITYKYKELVQILQDLAKVK